MAKVAGRALGRGAARSRRAGATAEVPAPHEPGGWGEAGAPESYDPGAPTGPAVTASGGTPTGPTVAASGGTETEINDAGATIEYPRVIGPLAGQLVVLTGIPGAGVPGAGTSSAGTSAGTMNGGEGTELPHWADPPTGEVPRALAGPEGSDDEMQAWRLLGRRGLHWREEVSDWSDGPGMEDLVEDETPLPADEAGEDPFSFDADFDRLERQRRRRARSDLPRPEPAGAALPPGPGGPGQAGAAFPAGRPRRPSRTGPAGEASLPGDAGIREEAILDVFPPALSGQRGAPAGASAPSPSGAGAARVVAPASRNGAHHGGQAAPSPRAPYDVNADAGTGGPGRDVGAAVATGAGLVAVFVVCYLIGPAALLTLAALALLGCALEAFSMLQEVGFRPATLVGALGSAGAVLAAYWKGASALPVVMAIVLVATFVWYLGRVVEARPVVNAAVSFMVFAWVGMLGSFAGLLLSAHKGSHLFLGAVVPTVLCDIAAWFAGSRIGTHHLAPHTSPGKTWEGAIAGAIVAVVAALVIGHEVSPWGGLRHGLELGLIVAVVAPLGDLVQSMVKRDLHLKDSGSLLPGHGGFLDRFDSLLFVLPAVYFLAVALHLAG